MSLFNNYKEEISKLNDKVNDLEKRLGDLEGNLNNTNVSIHQPTKRYDIRNIRFTLRIYAEDKSLVKEKKFNSATEGAVYLHMNKNFLRDYARDIRSKSLWDGYMDVIKIDNRYYRFWDNHNSPEDKKLTNDYSVESIAHKLNVSYSVVYRRLRENLVSQKDYHKYNNKYLLTEQGYQKLCNLIKSNNKKSTLKIVE